jgi:hypothetical protein
MLAQGRHQLHACRGDQARDDGAHASQCAGHMGVGAVVRVKQRQHQHDEQREGEHRGQRHERAAQAEPAVADHEREVHDVGARHDLRDGPVLDELFRRQPLAPLDHLALHDGEHAAEALQRDGGERKEQLGERGGPLFRGGGRFGWRPGHVGHVPIMAADCFRFVC